MTEFIKADREKIVVRRGGCNFDVVDQQKRAVGYTFRIYEVTFTPNPTNSGFWSREVGEPMHYFEVWTHATRNGKNFGVTSRPVETATLKEAVQAAERRMMSARGRERKRWARYSPVPQCTPFVDLLQGKSIFKKEG